MIQLGQDWIAQEATEPDLPPPPDPTEVALNRILVGLLDLKEAIQQPAIPPAIIVDPPDLSDIVTAVNGLKPGATADQIATAIAAKINPAAPTDVTPVLEELVKRLETLDFRQLGMGRVGGGTVTFAPGATIGQANPPWQVKDDYQQGEVLADQAGANAVLTFTFTNAVDFIWVSDIGTTTTNVSRADPFGGTPTSSIGVPVFNQAPTPIAVTPARAIIKVYTPTGSTISVYGHRRA